MNPGDERAGSPGSRRGLALLLASLIALTPLAIDAYLPALPVIAAFYRVDIQLIEVSISTFFFGYAAGQLVGAPFSDQLGRRPIVLAGLALFIVASFAIVLSTSVEQLLVLRFVQAFGGGFAAVNAAAMVRDLYGEQDSASMFALIALIMMAAPLLAPAIGAVVIAYLRWQVIFVVLMVYAVALLGVLYRRLPETNPRGGAPDPRSGEKRGIRRVLHNYVRVFRNREAMGYMLGSSFAAGCMFVFLTDAAFAYMDYFGASAALFPVLFGANVITMMAFTRLNMRWLRRTTPRRMIRRGMALQVAVTALLAAYVLLFEPRLAIVVPLIMLAIGSNGLIMSNSMAAFLSYFETGSGSANALFSTASFAVGGMLGGFLGLVHDGSLKTLGLGMFASATIALLANLTLTCSNKPPAGEMPGSA